MLEFTLEYKAVLNAFTSDRDNDMRQYEMDEKEWDIVKELVDILKVRMKCQ